MDPTTGALGGMEYGYSVMERLRLAALQGQMTQQPMLVTPGEEAWRTAKLAAFGLSRQAGATGPSGPLIGKRSPPVPCSSPGPILSSCATRSRSNEYGG